MRQRILLAISLGVLLWPFYVGAQVLDLSLSSTQLGLGQPLKVALETDQKMKDFQVWFLDRKFRSVRQDLSNGQYRYLTYVAVPRRFKPGVRNLTIKGQDAQGQQFSMTREIRLAYPAPQRGAVKLNPKKKALAKRTSTLRNESRLLSRHFRSFRERQFFDEDFHRPAEGRVSSGFGRIRRYNSGATSSHAGVDIANRVGTPVYVSHRGIVVLSESLAIHGHTVLVDHGLGVLSIYNHLSKRHVKVGQDVEQGDLIGDMGQSGVASGPHLHWGLSIQNVRVDPRYWVASMKDEVLTQPLSSALD